MSSQDPGIDRNVVRDSGKKAKFLDSIRDLNATQQAVFAKTLALRKRTVFGMEMTKVRDAGLS